MTKRGTSRDDEIREYFRGKLRVNSIAKISEDANCEYKFVITTYDHDPERALRYMDQGWDVVYEESAPLDDRAFVPDKENSDKFGRLKPITKRLKGGHSAILMKITKDQRKENRIERMKRDKARELASIRGAQVQRTRNSEGLREERYSSEIDLAHPENLDEDI